MAEATNEQAAATTEQHGADRAETQSSEPTGWKEHIPEKYQRETFADSMAALNKGMAEANKLVGNPDARTISKTLRSRPGEEKPEEPKDIEGVISSMGRTLSDLSEEWTENGSRLTDETYKKLAGHGFKRGLVDMVARTAVANERLCWDAACSVIGGAQELEMAKKLVFGSGNRPVHELDQINEMLTRDPFSAKMAATMLKAEAQIIEQAAPKAEEKKPTGRSVSGTQGNTGAAVPSVSSQREYMKLVREYESKKDNEALQRLRQTYNMSDLAL